MSRKVVKRCQRIKTMPLKVRVQKHQIARRIVAWPSNSFVLSYLKKRVKKSNNTLYKYLTGIFSMPSKYHHLSYGFRCGAQISLKWYTCHIMADFSSQNLLHFCFHFYLLFLFESDILLKTENPLFPLPSISYIITFCNTL